VINQAHATALPMPDDVIDRVHAIAQQQKANPGLVFADRQNQVTLADEYNDLDDEDNESYIPLEENNVDDDDFMDENVEDDGNDEEDFDANNIGENAVRMLMMMPWKIQLEECKKTPKRHEQ
jgi:hypothetical protein